VDATMMSRVTSTRQAQWGGVGSRRLTWSAVNHTALSVQYLVGYLSHASVMRMNDALTPNLHMRSSLEGTRLNVAIAAIEFVYGSIQL